MNLFTFVWEAVKVALDGVGFISSLLNQLMPGGIVPAVVSVTLGYYVIAVAVRAVLGFPWYIFGQCVFAFGLACHCLAGGNRKLALAGNCVITPALRYLRFVFGLPWPLNVAAWYLHRCVNAATPSEDTNAAECLKNGSVS